MNILIIGGTGFLGSHCYAALSVKYNTFTIGMRPINPLLDIDNYLLNINQTQEIIKLIEDKNIDTIIHCVSTLLPSSNINDYFDDMTKVYYPTVLLIEYCAINKIKFVFFSSGGTVYGNQHEIFNENTKREPISYYGLSKLNLENTIVYYHNIMDLEYLIIRPSNPYGPGQNIYGKQGLIAVLIGRIINDQVIDIWGNGSSIKDYIYIDDFIKYVYHLICNNNTWNSIYNIGSGVGISVNDVLTAFQKNNIDLPEIRYLNEKESDVKRMVLDCTRIQELINIERTPIDIGIKLFYDHELKKIGYSK